MNYLTLLLPCAFIYFLYCIFFSFFKCFACLRSILSSSPHLSIISSFLLSLSFCILLLLLLFLHLLLNSIFKIFIDFIACFLFFYQNLNFILQKNSFFYKNKTLSEFPTYYFSYLIQEEFEQKFKIHFKLVNKID